LKENYFDDIDIKEKSYWLGFLYAEGYIETRNQKAYRLGIEIGKDDEILIDRFIITLDIDPNRKHYRERDHTVVVKFVNKKIVKDLVRWGVVPRKSKIIELPNLSNRKLYLAFLLGFYDGDGKTGTTRIITGSKIFLEQIKSHFNLPFKIYEKRSRSFIGTRLIKGHGYSMSLGIELYNEMLANYHNSLQSKRHNFETEESRIAKIKANAWRSNKKKFKITKKKLEELVWQLPLTKIGKNYGVSDKTVKKWCKKWGISTPPRGYWSKKRMKSLKTFKEDKNIFPLASGNKIYEYLENKKNDDNSKDQKEIDEFAAKNSQNR